MRICGHFERHSDRYSRSDFLFALKGHLCGVALGKKIDKLLTVVYKIEQQDLDFEIQKSKLFEVDQALDALDHMRIALRQSLSKQWYDDKMRGYPKLCVNLRSGVE